MKNRIRKIYLCIIPMAVTGLTGAVAGVIVSSALFLPLLVATFIATGAAVAGLVLYENKVQRAVDDVFRENAVIAKQIINSMNMPCVFCTDTGKITWNNEAFESIFVGKNIKKLLPDDSLAVESRSFMKTVGERTYLVKVLPVLRSDRRTSPMMFMYWTEKTEELKLERLYKNNFPSVALIYVDNYEDLSADKDFVRNVIINEVEKLVSQLTTSVNGIYRRVEGARFMVIFEAEHIKELEEKRFEILNAVRTIETGTEQQITLSVGVGYTKSIEQSYEAASNAIELALGRGGDQVVVKHADNYKFYGGKNMSSSRTSRVKVRTIAGAVRELMESATETFIMGHRNADLDCVGSGIGFLRCASIINSRAYYVIEGGVATVESMLNMTVPKAFAELIITPETAIERFRTTSLIIAVDVQREELLCSSALYKSAEKMVIIDHHRRSTDALSNATIVYIEPSASSASEIITEMMQCYIDKKNSMPFEATAMLAGICLDTKFFISNANSRTFDAASYLRRCGGDTSSVKKMFQDDIDSLMMRMEVVKGAERLDGGIAIATVSDEASKQPLIAAQAADMLISVKGIAAAFVLTKPNSKVIISARSLGAVNVQVICEKLGGGGHLTGAGAQLPDVSIEEAKSMLKQCIEEYRKEDK